MNRKLVIGGIVLVVVLIVIIVLVYYYYSGSSDNSKTSPQWEDYPGYWIYSIDNSNELPSSPSPSIDDCKQTCLNTPGCTSFSKMNPTATCYLRKAGHSAPVKDNHPGIYSAILKQ